MEKLIALFEEMTTYEKGEPGRSQHFLKVYAYAQMIAAMEHIDEPTTTVLLAAALVHDCGIRPALEKYQSGQGTYQQLEGPPAAEEMLRRAGYAEQEIKRVCYLVGHHHTYTHIDGLDYQILVEADFLVNLFESGMSKTQRMAVRSNIFKTAAGIRLLDRLFDAD